ncbi:HNH endonuclease [Streptomyces caatingaensis]|uniref:HNH endonuclease n=1 Tax=Streptomyces caatingaensis TaxID=1678637 RepID=UPI00069FF391|nr:HNH endonuclease [Streptomyces caatingaensis]
MHYAIEQCDLPADPLAPINWRVAETVQQVDPRVVANPTQARSLLCAVSYVGGYQRARGRRLVGLFANELCPLCGISKVTTIDHQLLKGRYPLLAVVPVNLVPACRDCNTGKGEEAPATAEDQPLHPYYDDLFHVP